ncbi:uncharacterized protein I206_106445 [Kwoniella pini CBS 10737]|uniref:Transmembrane protein n=1 Tax=Kwoniella pini CBS 10737 TaxID=1296096 RepID=A0A1B9HUC2_9TREE|nr:uncharacterized protein I206_07249 [Kwoniella pini CBS 10737]OCF46862.1 hypothetical protein I206_07249 [Kwoniella pini CBS 10737]
MSTIPLSNTIINSSTSTSSSSTIGHSRNASTYISAEAGKPTSSTSISTSTSNLEPNRNLIQRSPSPSPTKSTFNFNNNTNNNNGSINIEKSLSNQQFEQQINSGVGVGVGGWKVKLTPKRIGKAIGARFMKAVKRGNLPFLLVFFSCTIVFFSALAGVGYHEPTIDLTIPTTSVETTNPEFRVGGPVFDDHKGLERKIAEQRALEESWAKKKRPKDGAWMRKQRDDKAIRRKPNTIISSNSQETIAS